jgi:hypothetical protein
MRHRFMRGMHSQFLRFSGCFLVLAVPVMRAELLAAFTSSIAPGSPTQLGRLSRNGIPQDWSGDEPFPGVINTGVTYNYMTFMVPIGDLNFVQISIDDPAVTEFASAYTTSYLPNSAGAPNFGFDTNWLGDAGSSGNFFGVDPVFFQVVAPEFSTLIVVVNNTSPGVFNVPFTLTIEGFSDANFDETPEPSSLILAGSLVMLLTLWRFRRRVHLRGAWKIARIALVGLMSFPILGQTISNAVIQQIAEIQAVKASFTGAEVKMESRLAFAARAASGSLAAYAWAGAIGDSQTDAQGRIIVDVQGVVTDSLLSQVQAVGGQVNYVSPDATSLSAAIPAGGLDAVAANPAVRKVSNSAEFMVNRMPPLRRKSRPAPTAESILRRIGLSFIGALTSQGYVTHSVNTEIGMLGYTGAGVKVGVLSDSASAARVAALIATGDLPANTVVLPGQSGSGTDEGTAMMEIVFDMAPGTQLYFATANSGVANFANNIVALQQAGCKVIVDDFTYFNEGAFQDGPIARAVNTVTAAGAIYFSSAANSGNKTLGTSGTWEGDFLNGGPVSGVIGGAGETGSFHNFSTAASPQNFDVLTAGTTAIDLKWSDPLGGSSNDYDLFVLNSTGTAITAFSAGAQTGTQDPYEIVSRSAGFAAGSQIVVVNFSGAGRALRIDTNRGQLSINTSGSTFGHNAGLNTVSVAATYWNSAHTGTRPFTGPTNPIEPFSSDGPRRIFYNPDGTPITPGNFLFGANGGTVLQKPDVTAADGVVVKTPGFVPFFGTSAAAPHAAGIAALILQARPDYTPAQVKQAMIATTVDNMAPGVDRDSGYGIAMANAAVAYALSH